MKAIFRTNRSRRDRFCFALRFVNTLVPDQKCHGCGVLLQLSNPKGKGFVVMEKKAPPKNYKPKWAVAQSLEAERIHLQKCLDEKNRTKGHSLHLIKNISAGENNDAEKIKKIIENVAKTLENGENGSKMAENGENGIKMAENGENGNKMAENGENGIKMAENGENGIKMAENGENTPKIIENGTKNTENALKKDIRNRICMRCHQLKFQGKVRTGLNSDLSDFQPTLDSLLSNHPNAALLVLVDVLDFYATVPRVLADRIASSRPVVLVLNKIDLLPVTCSATKLNKWLAEEGKKLGFWLHEALLVSGKMGMNIGRLMQSLNRLPEKAELFVVGTTNVGKSTLLNQLRKKNVLKGAVRTKATSSIFPGTTLGVMEYRIQSDVSRKVFDTPGLIDKRQLASKLEYDELKAVTPSSRLKARTFSLGTNQTLILGAGLAKITLAKGRPILCTIFMSPTVSIHMTHKEKANDISSKLAGKMLHPPFTSSRVGALGTCEAEAFSMSGKGWNESCGDIVFSGIGWVSITTCGQFDIEVGGIKGLEIARRSPLMPYEARKTMRKFTGRPK